MADYDSSLPVRTENAGDLDINISDAVTPSQKLVVESDGSINVNAAFSAGTKVRLTDGTDDSEINASGELQVRDDDANTLLGTIGTDISFIATDASTIAGDTTSIDGKTPALGAAATAASTPVNIASDQTVPVSAASLPLPTGAATAANQLPDGHNVTVDNAAGAAAVNIQDGGNSITVDAVDLDVRDLAFATDKVDASGSEVSLDAATLAALESVTVSATDLDIRDLSASTDSVAAHISDATGTAFSSTNPLPVYSTEDPADEISDYKTTTSLAAAASTNHDYTVSASRTFLGQEVWASASSKIKVEVLVNAVPKFVAFNSTAEPNITIPLAKIIKASAAQVIRITITNRDNQAQDVYSTLLGLERP